MAPTFSIDTPLSTIEMELLAIVASPFSDSNPLPKEWPIWRWVKRQFQLRHRGLSAADVLAAMPTLRQPHAIARPYGPIWRTDGNTTQPLDTETVGLSIVGFALLGATNPTYSRVAEGLLGVLRDIAEAEERVDISTTEVKSERAPLTDFLRDTTQTSREKPYSLTPTSVGRLLQREYRSPAPLLESAEGFSVALESVDMNHFLDLITVADYVTWIETQDLRARHAPPVWDVPIGVEQERPTLVESQGLVGEDIDAELWQHVRGLVDSGDWDKVAAAVAIFVEHRVRKWAGLTNSLVGKGLYATALGDGGSLRLGSQQSEHEGWRALAMGLAQAVGNVDRHRLQERSDARRYALGVLGLGSLLLTQIRYEHGPELD